MMNFFELFGFKEHFEVDEQRLIAVYQSLAKATHPDRYASEGDAGIRLAVQKSAQVNDAYTILKSPLLRAEHLLSLRGVDIQHETQTMQDPSFLMQQMEWREQLADIDHSKSPESSIEALSEEIQQTTSTHYATLSDLLSKNVHSHNEAAADEVRKLKFMEKLLKEIEIKEDDLFED